MLYVKICGVTRMEDALLAAELGASAVGFVFWPGSPRFIDPYRARQIALQLPATVTPVGVFVDQPIDYVRGVASLARLGAVQLHGSEDRAYCDRLPHRIIKAVPIAAGMPPELPGLPRRVTLLLDAWDTERRGGTGRPIDWRVAAAVAAARPILLSGGLTPGSLRTAVLQVRPHGIDASSGVEARPGVKDPARLREFMAEARLAGATLAGGTEVAE